MPDEKESILTTREPSYTKAQILTFVRYAHRRDLLSALLREDKKYTHAEIVSAIKNFMEGGTT